LLASSYPLFPGELARLSPCWSIRTATLGLEERCRYRPSREAFWSSTSWKSSWTSILKRRPGEGARIFFVSGGYWKDRKVIAPAPPAHRRRGHAQKTARTGGVAGSLFATLIPGDRITNFLENDGTLEAAQRIAGHADSRTTKLYDRRGQKVLLEDMERIRYWIL